MAPILQHAGLDPVYWMKHIKNIGATPEALKQCGPEHFDILSQYVRKPLEEKVLRKFLGMPDKNSSFETFREKQKQQLEEKHKKLREILQALKNFRKNVKALEKDICEVLNISPEDWISSNVDLDSFLNELESYVTKLSDTLTHGNDTSKEELIELVSDGRMLRGINTLDGLESKASLLRSQDCIPIQGPNADAETKYKLFTSKHQEDSFTKNMYKFGIGFGLSDVNGYISDEVSVSESEKHHQNTCAYLSTFKTSIVPLASCSFKKDFLLSQHALSALKNIEKLVVAKSPDIEVSIACENFFSIFGCCANCGPYTLGGIYWLKSFSEGFKMTEANYVKQLHSISLSGSGGIMSCMSVEARVEKVMGFTKGSYEKKQIQDLEEKVKTEHGQLGGPQQVNSFQQWKDGLVATNSTWEIIGQDTNLMYIWEILENNHSKDFEDVQSLSQLLRLSWEDYVHRNEKWQQFLTQNEKARPVLENVRLWNSSKDISKCIENLSQFVEVKNDLKKTDSSSIWYEFYLNQLPIQYYLRWVVEVANDEKCSSSEAIYYIMQQILEYSELVQLDQFPDQKLICEWLYPIHQAIALDDTTCEDLQSFISFLQKIIECIHIKEKDTFAYQIQQNATELVTSALQKNYLQERSYNKLLFLTVLFPLNYDFEQCYFKSELSIKHLEFLHKTLSEALQIEHKDELHAQAYLFLQALNTVAEFDEANDLCSHIEYLMNQVTNLNECIHDTLVKCRQQSGEFNFQQLKLSLEELHQQTCEENEVKSKHQYQDVASKYKCFLDGLSFLEKFPQKLTLQDALVVDCNGSANISTTNNPHELLPAILEKIKMSNHNCRKVLLYGDEKSTTRSFAKKGEDDLDNEDDSSKDDSDKDAESDNDDDSIGMEENSVLVHPMDSLLALIHCFDNFLRQDMYVKLNNSQLAVPFLLPDPVSGTITFPLWALRSIVKYWKCKVPGSPSSVSHEGRIVDYDKAPIISFIRFCYPESYSKSQILNKVISESKHDFFFNYECDGSSAERKFVDGLVEATWYLPSGEDSDVFNNAITFLNLRGNAGKHENQLKFLSARSYLSFVFINKQDINNEKLKYLNSTISKVVFLMKTCSRPQEKKLKELVSGCEIVSLSKRVPADIVKSIRRKIKDQLSSKPMQYPQISELQPREFGIITDEEISLSCQEGKKLAFQIMQTIEGIQMAEVKHQMVPLQGPDLWHVWAQLNKKQNRMKPEDMRNMGLVEFKKLKEEEKVHIRNLQLEKANKLSPAMDLFIDVLLNKKSTDIRAYFLQWLKIYLDDRSRAVVLPEFQKECKSLREQLRSKELDEKDGKKIRQNLIKQDKALIDASFGVEHFFRELAQIYECTMERGNEDERQKLKVLPKVAAQLLLKGYPLEIVDGDAAHIPSVWITAVLDYVKISLKTKNSTMFILSVLGIQSTGKSTLMNTLFGVRFSVSAGRCTRGAYFQLMKLNSSKADCDYMLIIDTEGLRAPELDSQHTQQHDNELATLVIGLADVTIINIFGEVPADINDILQTSVHAFIRMKQVDLRPSCQFVRHHVSNVSASKSNEGSQRFQQTLDDMTVLAARAQHCEKEYTQFSDVISFDNETDVQNFPSLYEGNPPMAPVNPAYSEAAQKLKLKFIEMSTCKSTSSTLTTLEEFKRRVEKLWKAILKENYVFSFKNTLEIEAYASVDAAYGKWSWKLQSFMLEWENKARNSITSSKDIDVYKVINEQVKNFSDNLDLKFDEIKEKDVKPFFEDSSSLLAPILAQWRARYEAKLDSIRKDNKKKAVKFCEDLIQKHHDKNKLDELKKSLRKDIDQHLKALVSEMNIEKDRELTEKELDDIEKKFNQKWDTWMHDVRKKHPPLKEINLEHQITLCIMQDCQLDVYRRMITTELSRIPLKDRGQPLQLDIEPTRHLTYGLIRKLYKSAKDLVYMYKSAKDLEKACATTKQIIFDVQSYFSQDNISYHSVNIHVQHVIQKLRKTIDKFDQTGQANFNFTIEYRIDLILLTAGYMLRVFSKQQNEELKDHPLTYLESTKSSYSMSFKSSCTAIAHEKASAMCLVELVARQLKSSLHEGLVVKLADDIKSNNVVFATKQKLKGKILLGLLEKKDFDLYALYLKNISQSYLQWIKEYIKEHCRKCNVNKKLNVVELVELDLEGIITATYTSAANALRTSSGVKQWLTSFQTHLKKELPLNKGELHELVQLQEDADLNFFTDEFIKGINRYKAKYLADFEKLEKSTVVNFEKLLERAAEIVRDNVAGCCEQCPFCKEQCDRTDNAHMGKHHCLLHRPLCLGGYRESNTGVMTVDICTEKVSSDGTFKCADKSVKYKDYQTIYPEWEIPNDGREITPYWKWFTAQYKKDIVSMFDMSEDVSPVPSDWNCLTQEDAKKDVKEKYHTE